MNYPMAQYLDHLIDNGEEGLAHVQILFAPGAATQAGAIRRCREVDGLYEFCTPTQAQNDLPDGTKSGEMIVVNIVFDPASVLHVVTQMRTSGIIAPQGMAS